MRLGGTAWDSWSLSSSEDLPAWLPRQAYCRLACNRGPRRGYLFTGPRYINPYWVRMTVDVQEPCSELEASAKRRKSIRRRGPAQARCEPEREGERSTSMTFSRVGIETPPAYQRADGREPHCVFLYEARRELPTRAQAPWFKAFVGQTNRPVGRRALATRHFTQVAAVRPVPPSATAPSTPASAAKQPVGPDHGS